MFTSSPGIPRVGCRTLHAIGSRKAIGWRCIWQTDHKLHHARTPKCKGFYKLYGHVSITGTGPSAGTRSSCIGLSIFCLIVITKRNYGGIHADASNLNVLRALIFFYALVLAQGGLFIMWLCLVLRRSSLRDQVCLEYGFQGKKEKTGRQIYP